MPMSAVDITPGCAAFCQYSANAGSTRGYYVLNRRRDFPPRVRCAKPGSTARQVLSEKVTIPRSGCAGFLTGWRRIRLTCLWSMPCPLQHTTRGDGYAKREFPWSASATGGGAQFLPGALG